MYWGEARRREKKEGQEKTISVSKRPYDRLLKEGTRSRVSHDDRNSTEPRERRRENTRTACRTKNRKVEGGD
jgi:hypothetical protein